MTHFLVCDHAVKEWSQFYGVIAPMITPQCKWLLLQSLPITLPSEWSPCDPSEWWVTPEVITNFFAGACQLVHMCDDSLFSMWSRCQGVITILWGWSPPWSPLNVSDCFCNHSPSLFPRSDHPVIPLSDEWHLRWSRIFFAGANPEHAL